MFYVRLPNGERVKRYKTTRSVRKNAKKRREDLTLRGLCINGELHGPRTHGCRCAACDSVHKNGAPGSARRERGS